MKKNRWFGLALVATMVGFSACTNEAEEVLAQESEIKLTSEIIPSRVANSNLQSTQIAPGQQVGVTITGAKNEHINVAWSVGTDGTLNNTGDPLYWDKGNASFYAYCPHNEEWEEGKNTFSVQIDQSTDDGYLKSDLLYSIATDVSQTKEAVNLQFLHLLSKINITLSNNEISESKKATVYICGTNIDIDYDMTPSISTPTSVPTIQNIQDIKVGEITSNAQTISAIIVPQTIEAETKFIKIEFNGKDYYFILPHEHSFQLGSTYNFNLKLKDKEELIELKSFTTSIADWIEDRDFSSTAGEEDGITEIYVETAGILSTLIDKTENYSLGYLKLFGKINASDLSYIKDNFMLKYLDLSGTSYEDGSISLSELYVSRLSLPANITDITGDGTYWLSSIVMPTNVTHISAAFPSSLKEIHCMGTIPPIIEDGTLRWEEVDFFENLKIYVPEEAINSYKTNEFWGKYEITEE